MTSTLSWISKLCVKSITNQANLLKILRLSQCHILANNATMRGNMICTRTELDLGITLTGGQSFRWVVLEDGESYRGVFAGRVWTLSQDNNYLTYTQHGSLEDTNHEKMLSNYFHLNVCLKENIEKWSSIDSHFQKSHATVEGVRILNQDVVENLFSFICSSNNNIIRISGMVKKLCRFFGQKICKVDGIEYYDFPTIESLAKKKVEPVLRREGFGYRAAYISNTALKLLDLGGRDWLLSLHKDNNVTYEFAKQQLATLPGVGPKVADCICLMSLGHLEAIPVDTHIYQVACINYMPLLKKQKTVTPKIHQEVSDYLRELWGPLAGWAQAIVFCAKINNQSASDRKRASSDKDSKKKRKKGDDKSDAVKIKNR